MIEFGIVAYIIMAGIMYSRLRALTDFSKMQALLISLTTAIPAIIRNFILVLEVMSRWGLELGFVLGGSDSEEVNQKIKDKTGLKIDHWGKGDE